MIPGFQGFQVEWELWESMEHCAHKAFQSNANHPLSSWQWKSGGWVGVGVTPIWWGLSKQRWTCPGNGHMGGHPNRHSRGQTRPKTASLAGGNQRTLHVTDTNPISSRHSHYQIKLLRIDDININELRPKQLEESQVAIGSYPIHSSDTSLAWSAWTSTKTLRK